MHTKCRDLLASKRTEKKKDDKIWKGYAIERDRQDRLKTSMTTPAEMTYAVSSMMWSKGMSVVDAHNMF